MVRKCIVPNCKSFDNKILCHRFPLNELNSLKWAQNLSIDMIKFSVKDLAKYVVCTLHFDKNDYKNELSNNLNTTALPKLFGHIPRVTSNSDKTISSQEISILTLSSFDDENSEIIPDERDSLILKDIPIAETPTSEPQTPMETSIIECTESEVLTADADGDEDCTTADDIDNLLYVEKTNILQYESDVEIIDFNEALDYIEIENETDGDIHGNDCNLSETVSLISSLAEANDDYYIENEFKKIYIDVACQSDPAEFYKETIIVELPNEDEEEEYKNKSRRELIELIKEQKKKISEVDKKLKEFQETHIKLVQSMGAFQVLLTKDIIQDG